MLAHDLNASSPWPECGLRRPPAAAAVLLTLSTRDSSPLLAVDPRAGDVVARRLRHVHGDGHRVLAWAVLADRALCLTTTRGVGGPARLASDLMARTSNDLALLGHDDVWAWPAEALPLGADHDLVGLTRFVLLAPERAGLVECWRDWRWVGSCHWPQVDPEALSGLASGLLWLDALTGRRPTMPRA